MPALINGMSILIVLAVLFVLLVMPLNARNMRRMPPPRYIKGSVNNARPIRTPLQIAATAGFEDLGMHAAYRTGQSKPWTIEVLEAPSESAANAEFKKLFEINISTDRR